MLYSITCFGKGISLTSLKHQCLVYEVPDLTLKVFGLFLQCLCVGCL